MSWFWWYANWIVLDPDYINTHLCVCFSSQYNQFLMLSVTASTWWWWWWWWFCISDGAGRSGVYIAIDANIELCEEDGVFDVYGYLKKMRGLRRGLVETLVSRTRDTWVMTRDIDTCRDTSDESQTHRSDSCACLELSKSMCVEDISCTSSLTWKQKGSGIISVLTQLENEWWFRDI